MFSMHIEIDGSPGSIRLFKSKSDTEYRFSFYFQYFRGVLSSNEWQGSSLCVTHPGGRGQAVICFKDDVDVSDLEFYVLDYDFTPVDSQSRKLDLDDEANPTKVEFNRPARQLEID